ncbi:calmin [Ochotona princeps]|uniref:calmin n=1 Tax=Ochotona princeps TaxID=9978 RepID=UPI002715100E|nr:calmin [Ochotona princeps]
MAAQEWDWFQREELIGHISDIRVQNLQVERENVQKRTFTRWMNLHLEKCDPPLEVKDLFLDIQDGKILMALLEVLSGRSLLHEYKSSSHRIFRLNNIAKALRFLEDSNVKLVSIDAAEIADGNPSLVLGLIWNIILFFQIKELTGNLSRNSPSSSLSPGSGGTDSDSSFPPTPTTEKNVAITVKDQRKAIKTLLAWVQRKTRKYGVAVQDFAASWRSGMAFLAIIKAIDPSLVDMKQALEDSPRENLEKAFSVAHEVLHIPRLLDPEDIMVDSPDEQSIVTYVAQFLERFPELEVEDFLESEKEMPIESTFVRIKETPLEQESKILVVTENGACAYTVSHDTSHPPPPKVFVCDSPESVKGVCVDRSRSLADSSSDFVHRIIDQVFQGSPGKTSSPGEPPLESSILATRKDGRRSNSLPIKKTVHFEVDLYKDASCSKDPLYSSDLRFEGTLQAAKGSATEDKQQVANAPEVASNGIPEDASVATGFLSSSQPSQSSSPCNDVMESPASPGKESHSPAPPTEDSPMASPLQIQAEQQLAVEAMDGDDSFDSVPLKTSKFNRDLVEFASTSQTFGEGSSPPEKTPAGDEGAETQEDKTGKRRAKSACKRKEPSECPEEASDHGPPGEAGPEAPSSSLAPEEAVVHKPEVYEKAKRKSVCHHRHSGEEEEEEEEKEAEGQQGADAELPSNPASSSVSLETLGTPSKERVDFAPSPPLSKVSVIPHDLFYYPHYEVPLAAVLEAYAEGAEDLKMEEMDLEEPEEAHLHDPEPREQAEGSPNRCNFSGPGISSLGPGPGRGASPALDPTPPDPHEDHQPRATEKSDPVQSQQVPECQESPNLEPVASPSEAKAVGESVSSKKKEKRKHVDHAESSLSVVAGTVQSSDDLDEELRDCRVPSRTSHSDSSIYIRRHTNRSLESDHFSYVHSRNAADLDDRRNRILSRKANSSGEAAVLGAQSPHDDSLTQLVQQPDLVYFILFLWLLVYCLLLFPQLDVNRL